MSTVYTHQSKPAFSTLSISIHHWKTPGCVLVSVTSYKAFIVYANRLKMNIHHLTTRTETILRLDETSSLTAFYLLEKFG